MIGLSGESERDYRRPSSWRGMSADDVTVLSAWVVGWSEPPLAFHTDVPLGSSPEGAVHPCRGATDRHLENLYCRRADAVVHWPDRWVVIEAKPYGTPQAVGQVLLYRDLLIEHLPHGAAIEPMVVAQFLEGECEAFYERMGVTFVGVGQVLSR